MKKVMMILCCLLVAFCATACSASQSQPAATAAPTAEPTAESMVEPTADPTSEPTEESVAGNKVLVVYYSATGSTKAVAETIAETLGADIFELIPVTPYTSDDLNWSNDNSRVSVEHNNPDTREVELTAATVANWADYDTVFVGYPIWWGIAAWPMDGFIKANDFTGKTVIPFCTSASSGLGQSGTLLADMAGTGDWREGVRFSSGVSADDVKNWLSTLTIGEAK